MAGGFDSLGLMPELLRSIDEMGWLLPTDIQDEAIPLILGGGDVMAAAETGSGKTAAFSLPMLQCVHERLREQEDLTKKESDKMEVVGDSSALPAVDIKLCSNDKDNMVVLTENGYKANGQAEKQWTGGRATHGAKAGKYYYEATLSGGGIGRLGFSTMAGHHEIGRDLHGFGYGGTAMKSHNGSFDKYGEPYGDNDVIGCLLDLTKQEVSFSKNGKSLGKAFDIPESMKGSAIFPAYVLKGGAVHLNFGQQPFKTPPHSRCVPAAASSWRRLRCPRLTLATRSAAPP